MSHDKTDEAIEQLFELLLSMYQIGLETSMKVIHLLYYKLLYYLSCHKIYRNHGGLYTDSPNWI